MVLEWRLRSQFGDGSECFWGEGEGAVSRPGEDLTGSREPGLAGPRPPRVEGEGVPVCICGRGLGVLLMALCTHTGLWHLDEGEGGRDGAVVTRQMGVETGSHCGVGEHRASLHPSQGLNHPSLTPG